MKACSGPSVVVPVAVVLGVPVAVVQIVEWSAVPHARVPAVLAVPVLVPLVRDVPARLALVPVARVLAVQMPVVGRSRRGRRDSAGVPAVRAVGVGVGGVFRDGGWS